MRKRRVRTVSSCRFIQRDYGAADVRDNARTLLLRSDTLLRDDLDRQIVAHLVNNARASYGAIGAAVGLSAPAVKRRVDRLLADGVITGFTARLDDEAIGATTEAFVELYGRSRPNPADIAEMVAGLPDVVEAYTVTGEADALLHVKTASPA